MNRTRNFRAKEDIDNRGFETTCPCCGKVVNTDIYNLSGTEPEKGYYKVFCYIKGISDVTGAYFHTKCGDKVFKDLDFHTASHSGTTDVHGVTSETKNAESLLPKEAAKISILSKIPGSDKAYKFSISKYRTYLKKYVKESAKEYINLKGMNGEPRVTVGGSDGFDSLDSVASLAKLLGLNNMSALQDFYRANKQGKETLLDCLYRCAIDNGYIEDPDNREIPGLECIHTEIKKEKNSMKAQEALDYTSTNLDLVIDSADDDGITATEGRAFNFHVGDNIDYDYGDEHYEGIIKSFFIYPTGEVYAIADLESESDIQKNTEVFIGGIDDDEAREIIASFTDNYYEQEENEDSVYEAAFGDLDDPDEMTDEEKAELDKVGNEDKYYDRLNDAADREKEAIKAMNAKESYYDDDDQWDEPDYDLLDLMEEQEEAASRVVHDDLDNMSREELLNVLRGYRDISDFELRNIFDDDDDIRDDIRWQRRLAAMTDEERADMRKQTEQMRQEDEEEYEREKRGGEGFLYDDDASEGFEDSNLTPQAHAIIQQHPEFANRITLFEEHFDLANYPQNQSALKFAIETADLWADGLSLSGEIEHEGDYENYYGDFDSGNFNEDQIEPGDGFNYRVEGDKLTIEFDYTIYGEMEARSGRRTGGDGYNQPYEYEDIETVPLRADIYLKLYIPADPLNEDAYDEQPVWRVTDIGER